MKIVHSDNVRLCIDVGFVYLPKVLLDGGKVNSKKYFIVCDYFFQTVCLYQS